MWRYSRFGIGGMRVTGLGWRCEGNLTVSLFREDFWARNCHIVGSILVLSLQLYIVSLWLRPQCWGRLTWRYQVPSFSRLPPLPVYSASYFHLVPSQLLRAPVLHALSIPHILQSSSHSQRHFLRPIHWAPWKMGLPYRNLQVVHPVCRTWHSHMIVRLRWNKAEEGSCNGRHDKFCTCVQGLQLGRAE